MVGTSGVSGTTADAPRRVAARSQSVETTSYRVPGLEQRVLDLLVQLGDGFVRVLMGHLGRPPHLAAGKQQTAGVQRLLHRAGRADF